MAIEIKTFHFTEMQVKADGDAGTIEGYGSTFGGDPDAYGDIVAKGAFADSIARTMPKMLYQHGSGKHAGIWKQGAEDNHGLYLKGNFINTLLSQQGDRPLIGDHERSDTTGRVYWRLGACGWNGHYVWLEPGLTVSLEVST